jgi:hypothetical protein
VASDMIFLGGLIGWFTWQLYSRLNQINKRLNAVEELFKEDN